MSYSHAAQASFVRSDDTRALLVLRRLARDYPGGASVTRGAMTLVGIARPAMLAKSRDGRLLAAVLLDEPAAKLTAGTAPQRDLGETPTRHHHGTFR